MQNSTNTKYMKNNWLKEGVNNDALEMIDANGGAIALDQTGALLYRLSKDEPFIPSKDYKAVSEVFTNFIDKKVELINLKRKRKDELEDDSPYVPAQDLKLVVETKFELHTPMEFIEAQNGLYYLNKYIPSPYMELEYNPNYPYQNHIHAIFALIEHLSNYNNQRFQWIINWLAYFIQGLKKSPVALVLKGDQGAGKNIFFNEIIKPIIGEAYTKTINDKTLNSQYLGGLIEDVLFFNLDEISAKKTKSTTVKNFLKALVTNPTLTAEKKFKTIKKETPIYGQVLITSNEIDVIDAEESDRRNTVYNTAGNLKHTNFLGYGSYESLLEAIEGELESFTCYLKNYQVDTLSATTAQMTPEKQELIDIYTQKQMQEKMKLQPKITKLQKSIEEFTSAIRFKDFSYFESIRFDAPELYHSVMNDLYNDLFRISNLLPTFKVVYGNTLFKTTSELLRELQNYDWHQFGTNKFVMVMIDNIQEECLDIARYPQRFYR